MCDLTNFGIYPDAIKSVYDTCEDIIQDVKNFSEKIGDKNTLECLNFCFSEEVLNTLGECINTHDITNSIISACFETVKNALESTDLCEDFGITFETYVNCNDSHLYFEHDGSLAPASKDVTEEYICSGDIDSFLNEALSHHLCYIIVNRLIDRSECSREELSDEKISELRDFIAEDLLNDMYDCEDIIACYRDWELTGTIREMADGFVDGLRS
ncbi:MAG: hypothetical protein K1W18_07215 [Oscillospiraceae bacterium]